jgi:protein-S-isoprenylcysteine O-methyltransferase Ste14
MGPVVESVARIAVAMTSLSLAVVGLAELTWEARRSRPKPVRRDTGPLATVNFAGIGGFVLAGMGTALSMAGTIPLPGRAGLATRLLGLLVLATAGWLAAWGLRSIGQQLASPPEVRPDTVLVTHGAFGLVRHPLYLSILLLWAGGALALGSWLMAAAGVLLVPAFVARCRLEERLLVEHFGDAYLAYAARVPMLLPRPHTCGAAGTPKPLAR